MLESTNNQAKIKNKKSKKWLPFVIIGAIVAIVAIILVVVLSLPGKINLLDYIKVTDVIGFNDSGYVNIEFDYTKLSKDLELEERKDIRQLEKIQEEYGYNLEYIIENIDDMEDLYDLDLDELKDLFDTISIEIDDNGSFSNGDTAVIVIEVDEDGEYGKQLKGGEFEHKIKGLESLIELNIDFTCEFIGLDGSGEIGCSITSSYEEWHDKVYFKCDNNNSLSNGDKITITAYVDEYYYESLRQSLLEDGYVLPAEFKKEFTVSGLSKVLTLEDCTPSVIEQAKEIVKSKVQLSDPTLVAQVSMVYFVEGKTGNHIVVALEFPDPVKNKVWNHIRYLKNVKLNSDGELTYLYLEHVLGGNGFNEKNQQSFIENFDDFYGCTLTKIG